MIRDNAANAVVDAERFFADVLRAERQHADRSSFIKPTLDRESSTISLR